MTTAAIRTIAAVLVLVAVMAGCRSLTGQSAGPDVDDATITASVKSKLVADKAANLTRVDVDTNHRTVYLNGTVDSAEQKARAVCPLLPNNLRPLGEVGAAGHQRSAFAANNILAGVKAETR